MPHPALQIQNLCLQIDRKPILSDLSFSVEEGEFISIIGPNGAGKTSLIKCISRIYSDWKGSIAINGKSSTRYAQRELARELSYVPQAEGRTLPFSVFDFVLMGRYPHLSPFTSIRSADKQRADDILEKTGLLPFKQRKLDTLSGGERQMVFIAAALVQGARTLLLDEPTSFLDYRHQAEVMQLLERLHKDENMTIISVSHDINAACAQSNRILALKNGTCAFYETPADCMNTARLEALYETPFLFTQHPNGTHPIACIGERK